MTYNENRRDNNEAEIVAFWEDHKCFWIPMDRHRGFDGILVDLPHERAYIVEIKNSCRYWKLTAAEAHLRANIGGLYHIITNLEDAEQLITAG